MAELIHRFEFAKVHPFACTRIQTVGSSMFLDVRHITMQEYLLARRLLALKACVLVGAVLGVDLYHIMSQLHQCKCGFVYQCVPFPTLTITNHSLPSQNLKVTHDKLNQSLFSACSAESRYHPHLMRAALCYGESEPKTCVFERTRDQIFALLPGSKSCSHFTKCSEG